MSCKNLGSELMMMDFVDNSPKGNTYEITISPNDTLIVTVQHPEHKRVKSKTKISPIGITCGHDSETGRVGYYTDFSIHPAE